MLPHRPFAWGDREAMLGFLAEQSFATIMIAGAPVPRLVHAPLIVAGPDRLRFHISRRNAAADDADGARASFSCLGPHAYVSPDWYGSPDQVPTWNYVVVEGEGVLRRLDEQALVGLLDALSATHEASLAPKRPWRRDKMSAGRFEAMLKAIIGFELVVEAMRGTRKLGQNKPAEDRAGAVAALRAIGGNAMAELMEREQ